MEFHIQILVALVTLAGWLINCILNLLCRRQPPTYPAIRDPLLTKSVLELVTELRQRKITSVQLVTAYVTRIKEVNLSLNAIVDERYEDALKEAAHADQLIDKAMNEYDRLTLYARYPLLGIPFTAKESVAVKGLSLNVGSIVRKGVKSLENGAVVELVRTAGGIPLAVSANPEFCMSFETNSPTNGKCRNPYDLKRTSAGSSGGEGALNGSGATVFGIASDISGSIRLPALFCGVFGHKPTGGLASVRGHFPNTKTDELFANYLQCGIISRFARDLPLLLEIIAGKNREKLNIGKTPALKDIKIYYSHGYTGLNGIPRPTVDLDNMLAMKRALKCFEKADMTIEKFDCSMLKDAFEIALACLTNLKGIPSIVTQHPNKGPSLRMHLVEILNSVIGHSLFTADVLIIELVKRWKGLLTAGRAQHYQQAAEKLKKRLTELLGTNGVLFLPTFHTSALFFNTALLNITGIDYLVLFNVLGFPATHVPMGLSERGLPVGFQVIAAPYQDKLCLQIAAELEGAFGGWVPPIPHDFQN